jgi:hypothetical protein
MSLTGASILKELHKHEKYKGMTDYEIKKSIGGNKPALVSQLKEELEKLEKKPIQKSPEKTKKGAKNPPRVSKKVQKNSVYIEEINKKVDELMEIHYSDLPKYICSKTFNVEYKKIILQSIPDAVAGYLDGWQLPSGKYEEDMLNKNDLLVVQLVREMIAFPLISSEYELPNYDDMIEIHNSTIIFSKKLTNHIVKLAESKNYDEIVKIVKPLCVSL